jgi:hypothetical protein
MLFSPDYRSVEGLLVTARTSLPKKVQMVMILPRRYKENPLISLRFWQEIALTQCHSLRHWSGQKKARHAQASGRF